MPHIHTEPGQHDHTATAFIIRIDQPEPIVLLHMHRKYKKLYPVGGHIELNESPWQAMVHEIAEESGYQMSELSVLQPLDRLKELPDEDLHPCPVLLNTHSAADDHYHSDTVWAFVTKAEPTGNAAEGESSDIRWMTLREIELSDQMIDAHKVICKHIFTVCLPNWETVQLG